MKLQNESGWTSCCTNAGDDRTHVQPGITTAELNDICHEYMTKELDCIPAPLNYRGFPEIHMHLGKSCHLSQHSYGGQEKLKDGDIVNPDITVIKDGYHGDTSKMFFIGKKSIAAERLVSITQEMHV